MRRLMATFVLIAACGGANKQQATRSQWSLRILDGRTADLDLRFSSDSPTRVVTGTLTLSGGAPMGVGGYADADFGHLLAVEDALHWLDLDFSLGTSGIAGELCDHARTQVAPQSSTAACVDFVGERR